MNKQGPNMEAWGTPKFTLQIRKGTIRWNTMLSKIKYSLTNSSTNSRKPYFSNLSSRISKVLLNALREHRQIGKNSKCYSNGYDWNRSEIVKFINTFGKIYCIPINIFKWFVFTILLCNISYKLDCRQFDSRIKPINRVLPSLTVTFSKGKINVT